MPKLNETKRSAVQVLGTVLAVVVTAGIAYSLAYSQGVDGNLRTHEQTEGHPAVVERVDGIKRDVAEIKKDVKELLKRSP